MRSAWIALAVLGGCADCNAPRFKHFEPPSASVSPAAAPLNLLLISLDTMRADHLSCYGAPAGSTPHLDRLAGEGALFENAYSQTNVTKPSHVSILTGLKAIEHGVFSNAVVPAGIEPLSVRLRQKGMKTAAFLAAAHLGGAAEWPLQPCTRSLVSRKGEPY